MKKYIQNGLRELTSDPTMKRTVHRYSIQYSMKNKLTRYRVDTFLLDVSEDMKRYSERIGDLSLCYYDLVVLAKLSVEKEFLNQQIETTMLERIQEQMIKRFIDRVYTNNSIYIYIYKFSCDYAHLVVNQYFNRYQEALKDKKEDEFLHDLEDQEVSGLYIMMKQFPLEKYQYFCSMLEMTIIQRYLLTYITLEDANLPLSKLEMSLNYTLKMK